MTSYEEQKESLKLVYVEGPEYEEEDAFGKYGFQNEEGEFVIEPQYIYAHEFTNGLAAVNLKRTWYRTEKGEEKYENHYGYIDFKGRTVIGFQFNDAYPFNKYGVAIVYESKNGWRLIDQTGTEIPDTRFAYFLPYYDYNTRFFLFSARERIGKYEIGLYDTKERKILLEPTGSLALELEEDRILIYEPKEKGGFRKYYINSKGETVDEGEMTILGECDPGFKETCEICEEKYLQWKRRNRS